MECLNSSRPSLSSHKLKSKSQSTKKTNSSNNRLNLDNNTDDVDLATLVKDPSDYRSSIPNDVPNELMVLDTIDVKPVTLLQAKNTHSKKIKKTPLLVLIDTGATKSTMKPEHGHLGTIRKTDPVTFRTPNAKFITNKRCEMQFYLSEFAE